MRRGFTLMELLIVVSLIAILGTIVLAVNVRGQLQKARDIKRKEDLHKMSRILEDYYNDNERYPVNDPVAGTIMGKDWGETFGDITLPKDQAKDYFYQTDPNKGAFFALYAKLENEDDPDVIRSGCQQGCGPGLQYNFVVHSPNVIMFAGLPSYDTQGSPIDTEGTQGGGGGTPLPTDTPGPTSPPVNNGPTPTPVTPVNAGCSFAQCGPCERCGGAAGIQCGGLSRCWYDDFSSWYCKADISCLWNPNP